jgi:hypothetical protein
MPVFDNTFYYKFKHYTTRTRWTNDLQKDTVEFSHKYSLNMPEQQHLVFDHYSV